MGNGELPPRYWCYFQNEKENSKSIVFGVLIFGGEYESIWLILYSATWGPPAVSRGLQGF